MNSDTNQLREEEEEQEEEEQLRKRRREESAASSVDPFFLTHPNFKSLDENVKNANAINNQVGHAINNQKYFEKITTPWETTHYWKDKKIQDFKIDLEKIDRLYYIYCDKEGEEYDLVCRMQGEFYINMRANCCISSAEFMDYGIANIFISRDANLFMNRVLPSNYKYNKTLIYESLKKDGIYIDENNQEKDQQQIETESNTKESEKDKVNLNKRLLDTETVISVKKIKKSNKKNSRKKK